MTFCCCVDYVQSGLRRKKTSFRERQYFTRFAFSGPYHRTTKQARGLAEQIIQKPKIQDSRMACYVLSDFITFIYQYTVVVVAWTQMQFCKPEVSFIMAAAGFPKPEVGLVITQPWIEISYRNLYTDTVLTFSNECHH